MKNFRKTSMLKGGAAVLGILLLASCSSDDTLSDENVNHETIAVSKNSPESIMRGALEKLNKNGTDWFLKKEQEFGKLVKEHKNDQNYIQNNPNLPLDEMLLLSEGFMNHDFADIYSDAWDVQTNSSTFVLDIYEGPDGWYVENAKIIDFYDDIAQEIEMEVDPDEDEIMVMGHLNLESIDISDYTCTVTLTIAKALSLPFLEPEGTIYGAEHKGFCPNETGNADGAVFLQAYANHMAWHNQNNPCPTGQSPYVISTPMNQGTYGPNFIPDFSNQNSTYWTQNVYNYIWKSHTNDCMPQAPEDWSTWYSRMGHLMNLSQPYFQSLYPNSNVRFVYTNYHSHTTGNNPNDQYFGSEKYYHGGLFNYGIIICQ